MKHNVTFNNSSLYSNDDSCDSTVKVPPVFAAGNVKYSCPELVKILLDKGCQKNRVSKKQPLRVTDSKVFLVDTNELAHHDDIKADDLGSWRNDGQHSRWVKVSEVASRIAGVKVCSRKPQRDKHAYCLHRHYFVHHSNHQFKRKIAFLSGTVYY